MTLDQVEIVDAPPTPAEAEVMDAIWRLADDYDIDNLSDDDQWFVALVEVCVAFVARRDAGQTERTAFEATRAEFAGHVLAEDVTFKQVRSISRSVRRWRSLQTSR